MPAYDYRCPECGYQDEVHHSMSESPEYQCPDCGEKMKKVFHAFNMGHGDSIKKGFVLDHMARERDMRQDMKENHGVENAIPLRGGSSIRDVYRDVKSSGSMVKEQMQAEGERKAAEQKAKKRAWMEKALRRSEKRTQEMKQRKVAEAAKKRAIKLS